MSESDTVDSLPDRTVPAAINRQLDVTIHGHVQGVGFRWHVQRVASRLRLSGWVANTADGSVRVVAEGPLSNLEELMKDIRRGPPSADVSTVEIGWREATGSYQAFSIRGGSHPGD
jgi:acylphosphatase